MHCLIGKFCFHGSPKGLCFERHELIRWMNDAGNYLNAPFGDEVTLVQDDDALANRAAIS